jgi:tetratricopeptide (TPR) repeat protein
MKKIPLRLYFMIIMGIFIFALSMMLLYRLFVNHDFVSKYNDGVIDVTGEEKLLEFNFPESYLPYYNLGNAAYKNGDYNSAISYYNEALNMHPSEGADCQIRINLALSLCNTINFYRLDSQEKIDTALFILYKARDVLTENGCASPEGHDGHNQDAQQLKEDIDRMIEMLQNPDQGGSSSDDQQQDDSGNSSDGSSGKDNRPSDREKKIQGELEGNKKDALEDRKETQGNLDKWSDHLGGGEDGDGSGDGDGDGSGGGITSPW